ncbi:PASTA domain-containing protein [Paraburkholderia terrae]|uniref:PASTA domain-containing protein n=1 Tax=Paraburkholderia terrae TaxID=311230 RepID=A0A2I8EZQ3_9BURK|nr:PASTA domain-containing protein [Paraburkholderia terrae]AUT64948.1 PASTA domain-containing protein [Paraburkholderia terrae]
MEVLNIALALAVANRFNFSPSDRTRCAAASAIVPGVLGLAIPFVMASRDGGLMSVGGDAKVAEATDAKVPDLAGLSFEQAAFKLKGFDLVAVRADVLSEDDDDGKTVVGQRPEAGTFLRRGSPVKVYIGHPVLVPAEPVLDELAVDFNKLDGKLNHVLDIIEPDDAPHGNV